MLTERICGRPRGKVALLGGATLMLLVILPGCTADQAAREPQTQPPPDKAAPAKPPPAKPSPAPAGGGPQGASPQIDVARQPESRPSTDEQSKLAELIRARVQAEQKATGRSGEQAAVPAAPPAPAAGQPAAPAVEGAAPPEPNVRSGRMEISSKEFDFGTVWQGMPATKDFTIKNVGAGPLTISAQSTCGCTVASTPRSPLAPGDSTTFSIKYNTTTAGKANKQVNVHTNDPQQLSVVIPVLGEVKALYSLSPQNHVLIETIEDDVSETRTLTLESHYDQPLKLKLREGESQQWFKAVFKEVKPGEAYELTITTQPPLASGWNRGAMVFETGIEQVPTISIPVMANVRPRVYLNPTQLVVIAGNPHSTEQRVSVIYRASQPIKIETVKCSLPTVTSEVRPAEDLPGVKNARFYQIVVHLPAHKDFPESGATLDIITDDPSPEFQKLQVRVIRQTPRVPGRGPQEPPSS